MTDFVRQPTWRERMGVPFAAGLTLLGFTLVNFLNYNGYPLLSPELGYFYAGLVLLSALMAVLYTPLGLWGRAFLEALLAAVVIDLNMESPWLTGAAFVATFAFVMVKRKSLLPFAAVMGSVMLVLGLAGFGKKHDFIETTSPATSLGQTAQQSTGPAIVHLIFDEQTGFEGFPDAHPAARRMKAELRNFYGSRGFAMFGRAYSEHYYTANSIPQMLNLGGPTPTRANPKRLGISVGRTRYLEGLRKRGYALHLYQTKYLDFCKAAVPVTCTTYDYSSMLPVLNTPLTRKDRAQLLLFKFLGLSDMLRAANARSRPFLHKLYPSKHAMNPPLDLLRLTSPISSFAMMDRLADELRHAKPGEAYVAHLLAPHLPSLMDPGCNLLPFKRWDRRIVFVSEEQRESAYYNQMRCTMKKTDQLLQSLAQSPAGSNSVVIVHGDHGSRLWMFLPDKRYYRQSSDADYIAAFSTLFAVRSPQIRTTYVEAPASVGDVLGQLTESEFRELPKPTPGPPMVYLADADWRPWKRVVLPKSWWNDAPDAHP